MFGCHGHSRNCKLTIVIQRMTNWPSSDNKITSDNILKQRFSLSSRDLVRDFEFQIDHCKRKNVGLTGKWGKNEVTK